MSLIYNGIYSIARICVCIRDFCLSIDIKGQQSPYRMSLICMGIYSKTRTYVLIRYLCLSIYIKMQQSLIYTACF